MAVCKRSTLLEPLSFEGTLRLVRSMLDLEGMCPRASRAGLPSVRAGT